MTSQGTKQLSDLDEKKEIEILKAKLAELEKKQEVVEQTKESAKEDKINLDDYIPVMSLVPYSLNLSTKERGQGSIKKFSKFGEVKRILYKDLVDIIETNPKFLSAGFYYILDPRVIRLHGLDDVYSKILTKDKIEDILSANSEEGLSLYNSANPEQQKVIIGLLIEKMVNDSDSVDLNVVDSIARISGIKISERVENAKMLLEQTAIKQ